MLEVNDIFFSIEEKENNGNIYKKDILNGISYSFQRGKFYAITGPNGSGKTTLAKVVMGIYNQTSGSILLEGNDISDMSITNRAKQGIAYGFQHPARFKGMKFRDLLSIAAKSDKEDDLVKILIGVGICSLDFLDKEVSNKLSGGEIKKVELATIIAQNPKVAIYDEPDTGIDLWTIGPMVELLKKECKDNNNVTVVVSHNEKFLEAADEIIIVNKGKIVFKGDIAAAMPLLRDMDFCNWKNICGGVMDVRCHR
jgi:Fe-S cluster assembly ATP-binding protein